MIFYLAPIMERVTSFIELISNPFGEDLASIIILQLLNVGLLGEESTTLWFVNKDIMFDMVGRWSASSSTHKMPMWMHLNTQYEHMNWVELDPSVVE